ncbi:unnamed protein product [Mycena citricolor]|uniref:FAD/NAD(P)-binding domain-containing protein n=1 Tax=Mycena citricolor TaxID=2018698 RepID=A0AAD2GUN4_9AGAR|nr:unnamed protein product [Mycena citricolor]
MSASAPNDPDVLIIGAGFSGLAMAIQLKKRGMTNFLIVEKGGDVGGTWRSHTYPPEIQAYLVSLAGRYQLRPRILFDTRVDGAEWLPDERRYLVNLSRGGVLKTRVLICAMGFFDTPRTPNCPGVEDDLFKGPSFHSARWDHSFDLRGKRVAVIGSGPSASQIVPALSRHPETHVTQYARSKNWFVPSMSTPYSAWARWLFSAIPLLMRISRWYNFLTSEMRYLALFKFHTLNRVSQNVKKLPLDVVAPFKLSQVARKYMREETPGRYHDALIPSETSDPYLRLGCKRIVFDSGYLAALARDNVTVIPEAVEQITETGIVSKCGKQRKTVEEYYKESGGPMAYMGTCLPGFPNLFLISGPNTISGHLSVWFTSEIQARYISDLIRPILANRASSIEVAQSATAAYNEMLQRRAAGTVWATCRSWYTSEDTGKSYAIFPASMRPDHYFPDRTERAVADPVLVCRPDGVQHGLGLRNLRVVEQPRVVGAPAFSWPRKPVVHRGISHDVQERFGVGRAWWGDDEIGVRGREAEVKFACDWM